MKCINCGSDLVIVSPRRNHFWCLDCGEHGVRCRACGDWARAFERLRAGGCGYATFALHYDGSACEQPPAEPVAIDLRAALKNEKPQSQIATVAEGTDALH